MFHNAHINSAEQTELLSRGYYSFVQRSEHPACILFGRRAFIAAFTIAGKWQNDGGRACEGHGSTGGAYGSQGYVNDD